MTATPRIDEVTLHRLSDASLAVLGNWALRHYNQVASVMIPTSLWDSNRAEWRSRVEVELSWRFLHGRCSRLLTLRGKGGEVRE